MSVVVSVHLGSKTTLAEMPFEQPLKLRFQSSATRSGLLVHLRSLTLQIPQITQRSTTAHTTGSPQLLGGPLCHGSIMGFSWVHPHPDCQDTGARSKGHTADRGDPLTPARWRVGGEPGSARSHLY